MGGVDCVQRLLDRGGCLLLGGGSWSREVQPSGSRADWSNQCPGRPDANRDPPNRQSKLPDCQTARQAANGSHGHCASFTMLDLGHSQRHYGFLRAVLGGISMRSIYLFDNPSTCLPTHTWPDYFMKSVKRMRSDSVTAIFLPNRT